MELKDYLHFYIGCEVYSGYYDKRVPFYGIKGSQVCTRLYLTDKGTFDLLLISDIRPILRPLSSMTHDELQECGNMIYDFSDDPELNNHRWQDFEIGLAPEQFAWLLSKYFDIFGLIKAGLAIDSTKNLKPTP